MIFKHLIFIFLLLIIFSCSKKTTTSTGSLLGAQRCKEGTMSEDKICFNGDWKLYECSQTDQCISGPNPLCENYSCLYSCNMLTDPDPCNVFSKVCNQNLCTAPLNNHSPKGVIENNDGINLTGYILDDDYTGLSNVFRIKVYKKLLYTSYPISPFYDGETQSDGSFSIPLGNSAVTDSYRFFIDALDKNQLANLNPAIPSNWKPVREDVLGSWSCSIITNDCFWNSNITIFDIIADGIIWNSSQSSHSKQINLNLLSNNSSGIINILPFATGMVNQISFTFDPIFTSTVTAKLFLGEDQVSSRVFNNISQATLLSWVNVNSSANGIGFSFTPASNNLVVIYNINITYSK